MTRETKLYLNENQEFVIENYNSVRPFSSFLPAIAGIHGKPFLLMRSSNTWL